MEFHFGKLSGNPGIFKDGRNWNWIGIDFCQNCTSLGHTHTQHKGKTHVRKHHFNTAYFNFAVSSSTSQFCFFCISQCCRCLWPAHAGRFPESWTRHRITRASILCWSSLPRCYQFPIWFKGIFRRAFPGSKWTSSHSGEDYFELTIFIKLHLASQRNASITRQGRCNSAQEKSDWPTPPYIF